MDKTELRLSATTSIFKSSTTTSIFKSSTRSSQYISGEKSAHASNGEGKGGLHSGETFARANLQRFYQSLTYLNKWKYSNPNALAYYMEEGKYATSSPSCHPVPPKVEEDDTKRHCELQIKAKHTPLHLLEWENPKH